jgi:hypothetical protein
MLRRMALMEGSMRTCSFSLRAMCIGFKMISEEVLRLVAWRRLLGFDFRDVVSFNDLAGEVFETQRSSQACSDTI